MSGDPRSHGLWERTAPPAPELPALTGQISADVVVVGAGYTGLSAALHLAEAGVRVVVLESGGVGFGASGRNVGLVNAGMWLNPDAVAERLGPDYGERILALLGGGPDVVFGLIEKFGMDCEPVRTGTLHLAVGKTGAADIASRHAAWTKRGAPVELLDAEQTARKVGSSRYAAALLDRRAGTIQPLGYVRGLARAALDAGATICVNSAAIGAERGDGRWVVRTASGSVTADWVIVATNAYTAPAGQWRAIASEIVPFPYFNFATAPLSATQLAGILPERQGAWDTQTVLSSFRLDRSGRLIFGSVGALRGTGTAVHRAWARRAMTKVFPQLRGVGFEYEWCGRIGMTDNDLPRFHELAPRMISFSGYNGRGIAPGTVFGRVLADFVRNDGKVDLPLPRTEVAPAKLRQVRALGIEAGAQAVHLISDY